MVPKDWVTQELDQLCTKIAVGLAISVTPFMSTQGVKLIRNQNIKRNYFDTSSVVYIDSDFANKNKSKKVKSGDVVAVRTGSNIGEACVVPVDFDGALTFTTLIARPNPSKLDPFYLATHINSDFGLSEVNRLMAGGGKPNLNSSELKRYKILTPPIQEQKKISKILSIWDKAITTTEQLLANSQQQKKALMQKLLTGKVRFSEFVQSTVFTRNKYGLIPNDWGFVSIEMVAKSVSEKNKSDKEYPVLSCSKYHGFVESLKYFNKKVYSDDTSGYKIIRRGEFGFPSNHVEEGSIGLQNLYGIGIVSPIYIIFKADQKKIDNAYLYSLLKTDHYKQIFSASTNASVDRRGNLRWDEFGKIKIPIPSLAEQQKISSALFIADKEIEVIQAKLNVLRQEKKALMQQLLTGKRRVKI